MSISERAAAAFRADGYVLDDRTAADLAERGYKVLSLPRRWDQQHTSYKVVPLDPDDRLSGPRGKWAPWAGLIEPIVFEHKGYGGSRIRRRRGFTAHPRLKGRSGFRRNPIGKYATTIAAAHALLDRMGIA